jgi:hypothetical protein
LVAGTDVNATALLVGRLLPNGTLDPAFAGGDLLSIAEPSIATSITFTPAKAIVVTSFWQNKGAITRILDDGTPDVGFDMDGSLILDPKIMRVPARAVVDPGGGLIVAGASDDCSAPDSCLNTTIVIRVDDKGMLDPAFGANGQLRYDTTVLGRPYGGVEPERRRLGLAMDGLGGVLVATGSRSGDREEEAILRATANGKLDMGFGSAGIFLVGDRGNWHGRDAHLLATGQLLVMGEAFSGEGGNDLAVERFSLSH